MHYADYTVTLAIRVKTRVTFARNTAAELDTITDSDAINNAVGSLPDRLITRLTDAGFTFVGLPIEGVAVKDGDA